jgi:hypothetical protein
VNSTGRISQLRRGGDALDIIRGSAPLPPKRFPPISFIGPRFQWGVTQSRNVASAPKGRHLLMAAYGPAMTWVNASPAFAMESPLVSNHS